MQCNIGNPLIPIGKIPLSAKGITDVTTYNHPIDICSERNLKLNHPIRSSQKLIDSLTVFVSTIYSRGRVEDRSNNKKSPTVQCMYCTLYSTESLLLLDKLSAYFHILFLTLTTKMKRWCSLLLGTNKKDSNRGVIYSKFIFTKYKQEQ